jgi:hypothetical protein
MQRVAKAASAAIFMGSFCRHRKSVERAAAGASVDDDNMSTGRA